jgi:uncharacterized protein YciI
MFVLAEAIYASPLPCSRQELDEVLLPAHDAHVRAGMERGLVLLGGPKVQGGGGFLLLRADSRAQLDEFLQADPLVVHKVQTFRLTPWNILDHAPELDGLFSPGRV